MERTVHNKPNMQVYARLQSLSELVSRANTALMMGQSYQGSRNIQEALGYPAEVLSADYLAHYKRHDIAKAVVDRPVDATWKGELLLIESNNDEETQVESAWTDLLTNLSLKSKFVRLDKLTALNKYGILLLGLSDVANREQFAVPVKGQKLKLLYVKPFGSDDAQISTWETDTKNPRYGLPVLYKIMMATPGNDVSQELTVHHTRVIHVFADAFKSEVEGAPILESIYNRLLDLDKLVGSSAEMYWRGARPGYQGKVDKDYSISPSVMEGLQKQLDEYEHNLRRFLVNEGVDISALQSQVHDPVGHVDIQIQMIAAATGIPKRILVGSERGELSSNQDQDNWNGIIQTRRTEYAEVMIVRPFIEKCIEYGVIPKPVDNYTIQWSDLFAMGEKQKAEVGAVRATALRDYASQPGAELIVPSDAFFEYFLGLNTSQIEIISEMKDAMMQDETFQAKLAQLTPETVKKEDTSNEDNNINNDNNE